MYSKLVHLPPSLSQLVHATWTSSLLHQNNLQCFTHAISLKQIGYTRRHAHNLSTRYKILESNVRPQSLLQHVEELYPPTGPDGIPKQNTPLNAQDTEQTSNRTGVSAVTMERIELRGKSILRPKPILFKGISIPPKPPPPGSDDCCMSSCAICVYDLYAAALEEHEEAIAQARAELNERKIPKAEWPIEALTSEDRENRRKTEMQGGVDVGREFGVTGETDREKQMAVVIGAFVEFEKALREKRRGQRN